MHSGCLATLTTSRLGTNRPRFYPVSRKLRPSLQGAKLPDRTQQQEDLFHIGRLICGLQLLYMQHANAVIERNQLQDYA